MTHDEAVQEAERLAAGSDPETRVSWFPRQRADGEWEIVKVDGVANAGLQGTAEIRADERPATADDPRTASDQDIGRNVWPI